MPRFWTKKIGGSSCDPGAPESIAADQYVGFDEARRILGVGRNTLYRHTAAGRIPGAFKMFGRWRYRHVDLVRMSTQPVVGLRRGATR